MCTATVTAHRSCISLSVFTTKSCEVHTHSIVTDKCHAVSVYVSHTDSRSTISVKLTACALRLCCCLNRANMMQASLFDLYTFLCEDYFTNTRYMPISQMPYYAAKLRLNIIVWQYVYSEDNTQVLGYKVHTAYDSKAVFYGNPESEYAHHVLFCNSALTKGVTPQHFELLMSTATVTTKEIKQVSCLATASTHCTHLNISLIQAVRVAVVAIAVAP
jgi:hypothetical protein